MMFLNQAPRNDAAKARLACALVAYSFGADGEFQTGRRTRRTSFLSQVAMYLMHVGFGLSIARVAEAFGRDRSTAAYACHKIEDARDDPDLDAQIEALEEALRAAPAPARPQPPFAGGDAR